MEREVEVQFWDEKLFAEFEKLKEGTGEDKEQYKFIDRALDDLKRDPQCGIPVPKRLIPKEYKQKFEIDNLWKYNLPGAWRLLYTLEADKVRVISIVLEWLTHKEYERRFNY